MSHDVHWRESVSDVVGGTRVSVRVSRMGGGGGEHVPREILQLESSYSIRSLKRVLLYEGMSRER